VEEILHQGGHILVLLHILLDLQESLPEEGLTLVLLEGIAILLLDLPLLDILLHEDIQSIHDRVHLLLFVDLLEEDIPLLETRKIDLQLIHLIIQDIEDQNMTIKDRIN